MIGVQVISRRACEFLSNTEIWRVRSEHVGDDFRIWVTGPAAPVPAGAKVGAIYALDGDAAAGAAASATRMMALGGELPPLYAISIGYPLDHPVPALLQRTRDLTPTALPEIDRFISTAQGSDAVVASGGADAFLKFIVEELRPAMEGAYPLDPDETLLTGISFGGLFALHAMLANPASFRRYLAISAAIWWDDGLVLRRARGSAPLDASPAGGLHLCAGQFEDRAHINAQYAAMPSELRSSIPAFMHGIDMIEDMNALRDALATRCGPEFKVSAATMPRESHQSVLGAGLSHGLRILYRTMREG